MENEKLNRPREPQYGRTTPARIAHDACIYAGLLDKDQAFFWLGKAYQERSDGLTYLNVEPTFDPLRSDTRFHDLFHRVGLSP